MDRSGQISTEQIEYFLEHRGAQIALVLWPGTQYLSGQVFDLPRIAAAAHKAGCAVGFDLAHPTILSAGCALRACTNSGADFAVWCSYKYLNAGPGAIGGCFVHERHTDAQSRPRSAGWWGHDPRTRFAMGADFTAAAGADGWQISNPSILSAAPLLASLEQLQEAGLALAWRAKSVALTGWSGLPARVPAHRDPDAGRHLLKRAAASCHCAWEAMQRHGRAVFEHLQRAGMVGDWREPDVIRAVASVPLYNSFEDVLRFATALEAALAGPG